MRCIICSVFLTTVALATQAYSPLDAQRFITSFSTNRTIPHVINLYWTTGMSIMGS